jgi:hypothetical protein
MPAKKDPNPGKLELRLLFFSSLIFISFGKALEPRFPSSTRITASVVWRGCQLCFEYRLEVARIAAAN